MVNGSFPGCNRNRENGNAQNHSLTDARLRALAPRGTARDIRDGKLKGFGVRVLTSGR